ncbi:regucalcin-like [Culicoides brevitarsis]|uniref:regucalcin-like n=1 Tax=Culicoides brevitarsis TaxID=469753 RepID=UPI00307B31AC
MVKVEQVTAVEPSTLLEGPHWYAPNQSLYFCDIPECLIFRYDYKANKCYKAKIEGELNTKIGFIVPVEGKTNHFVVGLALRLAVISWDGVSPMAKVVKVLTEVDQDVKVTRFNDGKVDPRGRIFGGTMLSEEHGDIFTARKGTFYRYDHKSGKCAALKSKICISNGLTWDETRKIFYYIDTGDKDIKEYDYNPATGEISNERVLMNFLPAELGPDGMTIDTEGNLYMACFNAGKVLKINPNTKKIVQEIPIPGATQITSVAFGGPNLDELFVTTAQFDGRPAPAGGLFKVTGLGVKGTKMFDAKLD